MALLFEAIAPSYIEWFTLLNNKNAPEVNILSKEDMQNLIQQSEYSIAVLNADKVPVGGIVTLREDQN